MHRVNIGNSSQNQRNAQGNHNNSGMKVVEDQRLVPKNIMYDKERLYEDLMRQKLMINSLRGENNKLKTRVLGLEEEISKAGIRPSVDYADFNQASPFLNSSSIKGLSNVKNLGGQYINKTYSQQDNVSPKDERHRKGK